MGSLNGVQDASSFLSGFQPQDYYNMTKSELESLKDSMYRAYKDWHKKAVTTSGPGASNFVMSNIDSIQQGLSPIYSAIDNELRRRENQTQRNNAELTKQDELRQLKQQGSQAVPALAYVGFHGNYPGDPNGYTITQEEYDAAKNEADKNIAYQNNILAKEDAALNANPARFASQGAVEALNQARQSGDAEAIRAAEARVQTINDTVAPSGEYEAQQTRQAQAQPQQGGTASGITPEALIQQLIDSVGKGQAQQESATREQFAQAQPALEQALNAALVRQSGGGRGGLDTGGMISAMAQQKQKGTVDLNKALSDVANFYSTLKQNALGQALTGSLNIAQMGQQASQFGQTLAQNNSQNLQQTELQKYLAELQGQQQNKQLAQTADQFAKSFGLQQQQQGWTQSQAALNRAYELQDWQKQADLSKELANAQPQVPEYSYWLNPLASAVGTYFGLKK